MARAAPGYGAGEGVSAVMPALAARWRKLVDGFWFVPGAVALAYALLAVVLVRVDRASGPNGVGVGFGGDADAARGILSTVAGSLITVAGLAFSLTIVILTLVSSQFTPRALPRLLADRINQVVAGSFIGIFVYCLLVLRAVRAGTESTPGFVPALAVSVSIALALVSIALLLVFIDHMGHSIQASQIAARIGRETLQAIDRLHPHEYGHEPGASGDALVRAWSDEGTPALVFPERPGYVQSVPLDDLVAGLDEPSARLHVAVRPGDFVTEANPLAAVWPAAALDDPALRALRQGLRIGNERDARQDAAWGLRQLADVAIKALSPGINDPTTADTCIGYLGSALERLAARDVSGEEVHGPPEHETVVVARRVGFDEYADAAFSEIGRYATGNARVVVAVLEALAKVGESALRVRADERMPIVSELARAVAEPALEQARTERDRALIRAGLRRVEHVVLDR